ncbi:AfsR/SARP family transcriptional regulator [Nonomuraea deserti]|uniref:AfsR/SARP family transcriptional regulator n=1 Tax=Nonomuraea deserti TaxID=1848322 RepID=A0A4R4V6X3_9ACTN|nr:AfsR/SARP family transcriptional regulator [Nonomuraea deserti]TDD00632.1 AfsR/SARP family transcriptional regulator [Nonomuraea deserti]
MAELTFSVLGRLEVTAPAGAGSTGVGPVDIGPRKQRMLLGLLLCSANRPVSPSRLLDALWWDGAPPSSSKVSIRLYVHNLRQAFGPVRLTSTRHGYMLAVHPGELDSQRFEELLARGRRAMAEEDAAGAATLLREGLDLWRDPAYAGLTDCPPLGEESARLEELKLEALHDRLAAELSLGRHTDVIPELHALVGDHPMRERFTAQLMVALYRAGRQAEALRAYQRTRQALVDELGVEPGPELRDLHQAVLRGDSVPGRAEPGVRAGEAPVAAVKVRDAAVPAVKVGEAAVPAELPADMDAFTGRSAEAARLCAALTEPGRRSAAVCAVAGPGGIGKSALAVHVAHQVADRYGDGRLYVDLHGSTPGVKALEPIEALSRMLRSLGVGSSAIPADTDEAAARLRTVTERRRVLLVLDNAVDAAQVRPLLPASPTCGVLITSRKMLTTVDGAVHERLDVLREDDAHALLARLLGPARVAAEPDAAAEVVRLCGSLPLAIRIAAARLTGRPGWKVRTLADRLAAEENRLAELEIDDRAVRTSFMPSYRDLDYLAARMFRLASLLDTADVGVDAAAALAGVPVGRAGSLLDQLADAQLAETRSPGRYGMHDLLRLFARERVLEEETEEESRQAVERVLHWYLGTARTATKVVAAARRTRLLDLGPQADQPGLALDSADDVYAWIDTEARNLPAMVRQAAAPYLAVGLATALYAPLYLRGRWREQIVIGRLAVEAAGRTDDARCQAVAHSDLGAALTRFGNLEEGVTHLQAALAAYREIGDLREASSQLNLLGVAYSKLGRFDESIGSFHEALERDRKQGNRFIEGITLTNLGNAYQKAGRHGHAVEAHTESLAIAEEVGNATGVAVALGHLAEIDRMSGVPAAAVKRYLAALDADRTANMLETPLEAEHWWGLGQAHGDLGDRDQARRCRSRCAAILDRLDLISADERRIIDTSDDPDTPEVISRNM